MVMIERMSVIGKLLEACSYKSTRADDMITDRSEECLFP